MKLLIIFLIAASSFFSNAQGQRVKSRDELLKLADGLHYQHGKIDLQSGLAMLDVPDSFKFLGPDDTTTVLVRMWGNPAGTKPLGMLLPAAMSPTQENCWAVVLTYSEDGYVKDDDASKIDYNDLLKTMKKATAEASAKRQKEGYPAVEFVGWATPPHYDAATHKLYWARDLRFGKSADTLNYNIRILGRRGVLVLNAVAPMTSLGEIEEQTPQILAMVNFNDGNRYTDFNSKTDKVAAYGIGALIAGGLAVKLGLFKMLWVFLLAAKKFVIIGAVAVTAWLRKIFSKNKSTQATPPSTLAGQP